MSPMGLAVLSGAGFAKEEDVKHIHTTYDVSLNESGVGTISHAELADELGISITDNAVINVCNDSDLKVYGTVLDGNGSIVGWAEDITLSGQSSTSLKNIIEVTADKALTVTAPAEKNKTIKVDFYVRMTTGATEIKIGAEDFGGYFYVEADTLYRNEYGKDMAATLTFPKVKINSGFTLSLSATGDPSEQMRMAV